MGLATTRARDSAFLPLDTTPGRVVGWVCVELTAAIVGAVVIALVVDEARRAVASDRIWARSFSVSHLGAEVLEYGNVRAQMDQ